MSEKEVKKEKSAQTYDIDVLRSDCVKVLGVSKSTFDGAMYGVKAPITVEQAKERIKKWEDKKISKGGK